MALLKQFCLKLNVLLEIFHLLKSFETFDE